MVPEQGQKAPPSSFSFLQPVAPVAHSVGWDRGISQRRKATKGKVVGGWAFSPTWGYLGNAEFCFLKLPETKEQEGEEERGNPPSGWVQQGHWAALASCSCLHTAASGPGLALFPPLGKGTLCLTLCP